MALFKTVTLAAALIAGATSLAIAQNGQPTGGEKPVAGGAAAGGAPSAGSSGTMGKSMDHKTTGHKTMKKKSTSKMKPQ
jgi:hypothetical protein